MPSRKCPWRIFPRYGVRLPLVLLAALLTSLSVGFSPGSVNDEEVQQLREQLGGTLPSPPRDMGLHSACRIHGHSCPTIYVSFLRSLVPHLENSGPVHTLQADRETNFGAEESDMPKSNKCEGGCVSCRDSIQEVNRGPSACSSAARVMEPELLRYEKQIRALEVKLRHAVDIARETHSVGIWQLTYLTDQLGACPDEHAKRVALDRIQRILSSAVLLVNVCYWISVNVFPLVLVLWVVTWVFADDSIPPEHVELLIRSSMPLSVAEVYETARFAATVYKLNVALGVASLIYLLGNVATVLMTLIKSPGSGTGGAFSLTINAACLYVCLPATLCVLAGIAKEILISLRGWVDRDRRAAIAKDCALTDEVSGAL